jgi:uncharacterized alpha/beta hydrolase family protein
LIHESAGSDLEMIMIKIRQQTWRKPKQAEALEKAIEALKERYEVL